MQRIKTFKLFEKFWGDSGSGVLPISKSSGRILLGLRSKYVNEPLKWGNFGGAIGLNDYGISEEKLTPENNAIKEFKEETSFEGDIELIKSYIYEKDGFKYTNFIGLVEKEFEPVTNWENEKCIWFTLSEIVKLNNLHFGIKSLLNNSYKQIQKYATN